ncbi:MAG: GTPase [Candidatus Tokpelaia sp. JSC189]|nr:MAG: GTPase [Candidatus Tokpelaia sp. JSC189]
MVFTVAIIGRPNVGKSTLFNRLVGQKLAIVDDTPGVTRDHRVHAARLQDLHFDVIDTAGLEEVDSATLEGRMHAQTKLVIEKTDLILFVLDAKVGMISTDLIFASLVRKSRKPVVLVANKSESKQSTTGFYEIWQLGLGEPCAISAEHGLGLSDLRDAIVAAIGEQKAFEDETKEEAEQADAELIADHIENTDGKESLYDVTKPLRIAIVGRPNAGKSTLINTILGEERLLTGPEAGITRDSIWVDWIWRSRRIRLYDTAGLRRKARIQEKLEKLSVADTLRAIRFAEVVIILLDAMIPFKKQDLQIADLVIREGRAPVIAFNKWDLVRDRQETLAELYERCERLLPQICGMRALPVSGEYGQGIDRLMENVEIVHRIWNRRIPTGRLNRWFGKALTQHPPPVVSGRRLKLKYITQIKTRPPKFIISCSRPDVMPQSYLRYLVNGLRQDFDMPGVPIRLLIKKVDNPFAPRTAKC